MPEGVAVCEMFSGIAGRYDAANHLLSGGVDYWWRAALVREVRRQGPVDLLDLATGSGDVALALHRAMPGLRIVGMDFCEPMLEQAREKARTLARRRGATRGLGAGSTAGALDTPMNPPSGAAGGAEGAGGVAAGGALVVPGGSAEGAGNLPVFLVGDAMALPLPDACFDAVTVAFGVRNYEDRPRGLREMARVLRPGGWLTILEFSQPYGWFRPLYFAYLKHVLPHLAALVTRKKDAYDYLAGSIETFPTRQALAAQIAEAGLVNITARPLTLGIVALHQGQRPG